MQSVRAARQFTARTVMTVVVVRIVVVTCAVVMSAVVMIGVMVVTGVDEMKAIGLQSLAGAETIAGTIGAGSMKTCVVTTQEHVVIKVVKDADEWLLWQWVLCTLGHPVAHVREPQ